MSTNSSRSARSQTGRRVAILSVAVCVGLAVSKIFIGLMAGSTSVTADGLESAGDVIASTIVLFGFIAAARPPDEKHPYGHGRIETLSGLGVGAILAAGGVGICWNALRGLGAHREPPAAYALWPVAASVLVKGFLSSLKFRYGRRIQSAALVADAWNDTVDILSGLSAMTALGLTLWNPDRFLSADQWGGFAVGMIVIFTALRVVQDTSAQLMDTMPEDERIEEIRAVALAVPGVQGVEKCYARKTGLQYHVDLHLEVDPDITVRASHDIATAVRIRLKETLDWIADVLVHVEPHPSPQPRADPPSAIKRPDSG